MAAYDAICFDLDSTLCEPTQDAATLLESTFERAGCESFCTPADLRAAVPDLPTAETDREFYEHLFTEVARRAGVDSDLAPTLAAEYLEVQDPTAVEFRP
ncbi:HAD family hydrolase, partial [Natrinema soli]